MKSFWIITLIGFSVFSCLKKRELPAEPRITSQAFTISADSAILQLGFSDGDGNFGLEDDDTTGQFAPCLRRLFNLYAEYYELHHGEWQHVDLNPCENPNAVPFYNRVPWVKPTGQNQAQEGEIKVVMQNWYLDSENDTIKFEVKIVDRDMHESNTVTIGPYVKQ